MMNRAKIFINDYGEIVLSAVAVVTLFSLWVSDPFLIPLPYAMLVWGMGLSANALAIWITRITLSKNGKVIVEGNPLTRKIIKHSFIYLYSFLFNLGILIFLVLTIPISFLGVVLVGITLMFFMDLLHDMRIRFSLINGERCTT